MPIFLARLLGIVIIIWMAWFTYYNIEIFNNFIELFSLTTVVAVVYFVAIKFIYYLFTYSNKKDSIYDYMYYNFNDNEAKIIQHKAQQYLPYLLKAIDDNIGSIFIIPTDNKFAHEHLLVHSYNKENNTIICQDQDIYELSGFSTRVAIKYCDIADWYYQKYNYTYGGFERIFAIQKQKREKFETYHNLENLIFFDKVNFFPSYIAPAPKIKAGFNLL